MQQEPDELASWRVESGGGPAYAPLLHRLRGSIDALIEEVVRDVAIPGEDAAVVAELVRPVVEWTLDALSEGDILPAERLDALREEGRRAAVNGESLQRLLDRYLSTGWVLWGAATRDVTADEAGAVPALGTALLKAGDAAAAAIAGGYGEAERSLALRAAGARREFMDALLDLTPGDVEAAARVRRRAAEFGLDPAATYRVVVAMIEREVADGSDDLAALAEQLLPPEPRLPRRPGAGPGERATAMPLVAARRGRIVVLVPGEQSLPATLAPAFASLATGGWLAVAAPPVVGLARVGEAYGTAIEALIVGARVDRSGLIDADEVLLERALLADEPLLARAVARELGPILGAARNAQALLETLDAFLASAENLRATARRLGIAPRTVAYRMARIERLLGEPVRGERLQRLATALLAARLLPGAVPPITSSPKERADRPRRAPHDRSRTRRTRATAK